MKNEGFEAELELQETSTLKETAEKPLKTQNNFSKRVDINVLKARAKAIQDKENTKNTIVIIVFLITLGATGIFFSI